jgi:hypothetical protein
MLANMSSAPPIATSQLAILAIYTLVLSACDAPRQPVSGAASTPNIQVTAKTSPAPVLPATTASSIAQPPVSANAAVTDGAIAPRNAYIGTPLSTAETCLLAYANSPDPATSTRVSCTTADAPGFIEQLYKAIGRTPKAATLLSGLYTEFGVATGEERDHMMDGGYRGTIHIVPERPTEKELQWVYSAFSNFAKFELAVRGKAGKPGTYPRYRMRNLTLKFFRSQNRTTPSAYAAPWYVAYNLSGSLLRTETGVDETLVHELFHANDGAHNGFSFREFGQVHASIKRKCGSNSACLEPYSPGDTMVRGGTYYAFHATNDAGEYGAELAVRYFREQKAALAGSWVSAKGFKCRAAENREAWTKLVHEYFDDVDITGDCPASAAR